MKSGDPPSSRLIRFNDRGISAKPGKVKDRHGGFQVP
jgi:hypothetical protein